MKKTALTIIFILQCSFPLKELSKREEKIKSTDNQWTVIFNNFYQDFLEQEDLNLRFRFLPYIESSSEKIRINHFQDNIDLVFSSNSLLFDKLDKNNFKYKNLTDQYHVVDLELRYSSKLKKEELFYPTIIFMIESKKINQKITSFNGVGLNLFIRFSIFQRSGEEAAYCQKRLNSNIFSNDFLLNIILEDNSPFLKNLNDPNEFKNDTFIKQKIKECKEELFKKSVKDYFETK
ncbi:MAG: hypothetical protein O9264_02760 [Leptospira sp.]|nr:hypothetical protein [Leptospira sp.]